MEEGKLTSQVAFFFLSFFSSSFREEKYIPHTPSSRYSRTRGDAPRQPDLFIHRSSPTTPARPSPCIYIYIRYIYYYVCVYGTSPEETAREVGERETTFHHQRVFLVRRPALISPSSHIILLLLLDIAMALTDPFMCCCCCRYATTVVAKIPRVRPRVIDGSYLNGRYFFSLYPTATLPRTGIVIEIKRIFPHLDGRSGNK